MYALFLLKASGQGEIPDYLEKRRNGLELASSELVESARGELAESVERPFSLYPSLHIVLK